MHRAVRRRAARIAVTEVRQHHATWSMAQLRFAVHRALPVLTPAADGEVNWYRAGTELAAALGLERCCLSSIAGEQRGPVRGEGTCSVALEMLSEGVGVLI